MTTREEQAKEQPEPVRTDREDAAARQRARDRAGQDAFTPNSGRIRNRGDRQPR